MGNGGEEGEVKGREGKGTGAPHMTCLHDAPVLMETP